MQTMALISLLLFILCPPGSAAEDSRRNEKQGVDLTLSSNRTTCQLSHDAGPCRARVQRWYYSSDDHRCHSFVYGGCAGNGNNFRSKQRCEERCKRYPKRQPAMDPCQQPMDTGPCLAYVQMWYFDQKTGKCETFVYGGCEGNSNKFESKEQCERQCQRWPNPQGNCLLQKEAGPCAGYYVKWYFDVRTRRCEQFVYGGCGGNLNNFDSRQECEAECEEEIRSYGICGQPMEAGPCHAALRRWYFSLETQRCEQFYYGGCQGNSNNFESQQDCEQRCLEKLISNGVCGQPADTGPCTAAHRRWYFNSYTRTCEQFIYGGCGGNSNNFNTKQECEHECHNELRSYGICGQPLDSGPCKGSLQRWYFNVASGKCEPFAYGGCGGNTNNFESKQDCRERCFREVTCNQPMDDGPCVAFQTKWYYNRDSRRCETFTYGGCQGNANRFDSQEACEKRCVNDLPSGRDCYLPMEPGPCSESIYRWFYNSYTRICEQFAYSGCGGNKNNFNTKEACEQRCII